jgi:two-component system sensor histidine kinase QseC
MSEGGSVHWSAETTEQGMVVFVEDTGPGIPEEELALVTNRFFRGRKKSALGSGLGLSIVTLALEAHGARLRLRNRTDISGLRAEIVWDVQPPTAWSPARGERLQAYRPAAQARLLPERPMAS